MTTEGRTTVIAIASSTMPGGLRRDPISLLIVFLIHPSDINHQRSNCCCAD